MHAAIEAHGPGHPEVVRHACRLDALGVVDLTVLFVMIWDMALKPTADDTGTLLVAAVALAAAALFAVRAYRPTGTEAATETA